MNRHLNKYMPVFFTFRLWQWRRATSSRWTLLSMRWLKTWPCWHTSMRRPCCGTCAVATLPGWSTWVCHYSLLVLPPLPCFHDPPKEHNYQINLRHITVLYATSSCFLRPTPGSSVWQWIHTSGCPSTRPPWSLPTKASAAPRCPRTSTP